MTDAEQIKIAVDSLSKKPPHEDPYPSQFAMEAAVELEVCAALGCVQTQTIGKIIQRAIDKAIAASNGQYAGE